MSAGWVGEQVSPDHTVVPSLSGGRPIGGPISGSPSPTVAQQSPAKADSGRSVPIPAVLAGIVAALLGAAGLWFMAFSTPQAEPEPPVQLAMATDPTQRIIISDGVMYLEGTVPNESDLLRLQGAAEDAVGVDRVVNNLELSADAFFDPSLPISLGVADTVRFSTGRAEVAEEYEPLIELAVHLLRSQPDTSLTLIGHTDDRGSEELNLELSFSRATAVADEIYRRGVADGRLAVDARGESKPIAPNDSPEGRSANRRVEFLMSGLLN